MYSKDFDRNHRNGCKRFLDFWRKVSEKKINITIISNLNSTKLYSLEYNDKDGEQFISLVDGGITFFFPLLDIPEEGNDTINFDDEIVESNLNALFKLLNNKKNFNIF